MNEAQETEVTMSAIVARNLTRLAKYKSFEICTTTNLYTVMKDTVFVGEGNKVWIIDNQGNKSIEMELHAFKCYQ